MDEGDRTGPDEERSDETDLEGDGSLEGDELLEDDEPSEDGESLEDDEPSEDGREIEQGGVMKDDGPSDPSSWTDRERATQADGDGLESDRGLWDRFRHDREGALMWIREVLSSVAIVLAVGLVLFGVSGVWPPMVAVESGSMEPNMQVGDLVFVTEPGRLAPDAADDETGVVTYDVGERVDYRTFGSYGSVVIYQPPGRTASPIIHRAMFQVERGENWYERADATYHSAESCDDLRNCPAPHDGYITLGDNNGVYDQARGIAEPVKREWVTGVARVRVPYLGYVRLIATGKAEPSDAIDAVAG